MRSRKMITLLLALMLAAAPALSARAYRSTTLHAGMRGDEVATMQTALIKLGYLGGTADGIFGINTEKAVRNFQRACRLTADGLAGEKTLELLYQKAKIAAPAKSEATDSAKSAKSAPAAASSAASKSSSLFSGNYATLRVGNTGERVKALQNRLISLGYLSGSADGKYGQATRKAVMAYQQASGLTADGLAGQRTLKALEGNNAPAQEKAAPEKASPSGSSSPSSAVTVTGPSGGQVKLLHWYKDIKPKLRYGQTLQIYEPKSGLGWNLKVYSRGRHLDAEPATAGDTANMLKAFGGKNTWSQKGVYVKLPDGVWTIGATHDMPHQAWGIKDNNFDGHLCVHFLRDMDETVEKDPNYGVSNQNTIRSFWYALTGERLEN